MSIWGKIIGGTTGFALGGPLGALAGALAGHIIIDTMVATSSETISHTKELAPSPYADSDEYLASKQAAFSIALVALSAKMAKADGVVSRHEILAFREKVDIPQKDLEAVGRLWDLARETPYGIDSYARQVASFFPQGSVVLEQLMGLLFYIAQADGGIEAQEEAYLREIAGILGFDDEGYERLTYIYGDKELNPYHILGVEPDCDAETLRKVWLEMARLHHPDRLIAEGLPAECIRAANERLAEINTAYETLKSKHKKN